MTLRVLAGLALIASACAAPPTSIGWMPEGGEGIARFGEARALATDGAGRLYVVDAAASEVVILDTSGALLDRLGGTDDQPFLDVTDVDPTNGQAIFVADAGAGRIVRFTAEGRAAEIIPVPQRSELPARASDGVGRPVAVATGPGNTLYAVEAERGAVLRWDADRTLDRVMGGPASSRPLRSPSALAVSKEGAVLVADGDRIVVFDAFGAVQREHDGDRIGPVVNIAVADGVELAVGPTAILRLDGGGEVRVELGEAVVDVAIVRQRVYVLTRTRLVRMPFRMAVR